MAFCPIIKEECREDCKWLYRAYSMDDSGVAYTPHCAVEVIANSCFEWPDEDKGRAFWNE